MSRDSLFLLAPGFESDGVHQYCPECAEVWGLLAYYPAIRDTLYVIYQPLRHPRPGLTARLGVGDWNCPTLILDDRSADGPGLKSANGLRYVDNARDIGRYWATLYGTAVPR